MLDHKHHLYLHLYLHIYYEVLPIAAGEELTRSNGKFHPNFRIFATVNMQRLHSNRLSAAFLNRVIRIWVPPIDARSSELRAAGSLSDPLINATSKQKDVQDVIRNQDVFPIVLDYFTDMPGGTELACLVLQFHFTVQVSKL